MIAICSIIIFSLLFVALYIKQLIDISCFLSRKEKIEVKDTSKKAILKKRLELIGASKKYKLQSKKYYAKFLYDKKYSSISISVKFLIDEIYKKLCLNHFLFKYQIDFDMLKNSGIFNEKPLYKINVVDDKKYIENIIFALNEVYKNLEFRAVFVLNEESDNNTIRDLIFQKCKALDYKLIFFKDINLRLLQEINKLDLNYQPYNLESVDLKNNFTSNIKLEKTKSNFMVENYISNCSECDIKLTKFLDFSDNDLEKSNVCYFINILKKSDKNKQLKVNFNYKLKSEFFNLKEEKNKIIIEYFNNKLDDDYFSFNSKIKKYKIVKNKENIFIILYFNLIFDKINSFFYLANKDKDDICEINKNELLKLIYENNLIIEKIFNFKIYIKNNKFNSLFNNNLKKIIINEKLNKNEENNKFILPKDIIFLLTKVFNFDYKQATKIQSYFDLYQVIVREVFGIKLNGNILYVNPNQEFFSENFKIVFTDKNYIQHGIYVDQNRNAKGLEVDEVFYSNLKVVDLSLIKKNAKLCL